MSENKNVAKIYKKFVLATFLVSGPCTEGWQRVCCGMLSTCVQCAIRFAASSRILSMQFSIHHKFGDVKLQNNLTCLVNNNFMVANFKYF